MDQKWKSDWAKFCSVPSQAPKKSKLLMLLLDVTYVIQPKAVYDWKPEVVKYISTTFHNLLLSDLRLEMTE